MINSGLSQDLRISLILHGCALIKKVLSVRHCLSIKVPTGWLSTDSRVYSGFRDY